MGTRKWDPKIKAAVVLAGLKGKTVPEICAEYQVNQSQYYKWRDQLMAHIDQAFKPTSSREKILTRENEQLKKIVGELTIELKKSVPDWP